MVLRPQIVIRREEVGPEPLERVRRFVQSTGCQDRKEMNNARKNLRQSEMISLLLDAWIGEKTCPLRAAHLRYGRPPLPRPARSWASALQGL